MSPPRIDTLVTALQRPEALGAMGPAAWDLIIRQGRQADLLARTRARVDQLSATVEQLESRLAALDK